MRLQSQTSVAGTFDETVADRARGWLDNLAATHEPLWLVLEQSEAAADAHIRAWKRRCRMLATSTREAWHQQPKNRNHVDGQCAPPRPFRAPRSLIPQPHLKPEPPLALASDHSARSEDRMSGPLSGRCGHTVDDGKRMRIASVIDTYPWCAGGNHVGMFCMEIVIICGHSSGMAHHRDTYLCRVTASRARQATCRGRICFVWQARSGCIGNGVAARPRDVLLHFGASFCFGAALAAGHACLHRYHGDAHDRHLARHPRIRCVSDAYLMRIRCVSGIPGHHGDAHDRHLARHTRIRCVSDAYLMRIWYSPHS